jgi:hypothetical protein
MHRARHIVGPPRLLQLAGKAATDRPRAARNQRDLALQPGSGERTRSLARFIRRILAQPDPVSMLGQLKQRPGLGRADHLRSPRRRGHSLRSGAQREQPANDRATTHSVEEVDVNGQLVNIGRPSVDHAMLDPGRVELGHQTVEQHRIRAYPPKPPRFDPWLGASQMIVGVGVMQRCPSGLQQLLAAGDCQLATARVGLAPSLQRAVVAAPGTKVDHALAAATCSLGDRDHMTMSAGGGSGHEVDLELAFAGSILAKLAVWHVRQHLDPALLHVLADLLIAIGGVAEDPLGAPLFGLLVDQRLRLGAAVSTGVADRAATRAGVVCSVCSSEPMPIKRELCSAERLLERLPVGEHECVLAHAPCQGPGGVLADAIAQRRLGQTPFGPKSINA